jgi:hypothetical protein
VNFAEIDRDGNVQGVPVSLGSTNSPGTMRSRLFTTEDEYVLLARTTSTSSLWSPFRNYVDLLRYSRATGDVSAFTPLIDGEPIYQSLALHWTDGRAGIVLSNDVGASFYQIGRCE